jgi:hypothetical protein
MNNPPAVLDKVELLLTESKYLKAAGAHFRIVHRFRIPGTECLPGEEVAAVYLLHRGREYLIPFSITLRLLFDCLAKSSRAPQSASQIKACFRADPFYVRHGMHALKSSTLRRRIARSAIKVYIQRTREALARAFREANLRLNPRDVLVSQETVMNEVGYRLRGTFQWVQIDRQEKRLW